MHESKNSKTFTTLVTSLVDWFQVAARPLPWRKKNPNPYEIWISEIMSQQSTLKMMLPFFERWMIRFPTVESLASAPQEELLKHWEGLGYYSRARNIHASAKILAKKFPQTPTELIQLPGIGPYTAAAIASISFDYPAVPVDGNVTRVLSRYLGIKNPYGEKKDLQSILKAADEIASYVPEFSRGTLSQALMELGALVCKPGSQARCFECPIKKNCIAAINKEVAELPYPKLRPEMKKLSRLLLLYRNSRGEVLLRKRPESGVLGGQWEIPYLDLDMTSAGLQRLFGPHFELHFPLKHTIMSSSYTLWPIELGRGPRVLPSEHCYYKEGFQGVLSTATRKFLHKSNKKSID
ncbi:MAG: A/G-specific adenine glycosylase [Bdellovibrionota bacterium]